MTDLWSDGLLLQNYNNLDFEKKTFSKMSENKTRMWMPLIVNLYLIANLAAYNSLFWQELNDLTVPDLTVQKMWTTYLIVPLFFGLFRNWFKSVEF